MSFKRNNVVGNNSKSNQSAKGRGSKARRRQLAAAVAPTLAGGFEQLESRQMMSVVNVADFGAAVNDGRDDSASIRAAINAAQPGDTVKFNAGTYNLTGQILFQSGETYSGGKAATLKWSGLTQGQYGAVVTANASNVKIDGLKFDGTGIKVADGSFYKNITITNNEITHTATNTPGVYAYTSSQGLKIEGNYFHDFEYWGALIASMDNGSYSHNVFQNIVQGAHILNPGSNDQASFNVGVGLKRMGLEIQQSYGDISKNGTFNLTVEGNVFYSWRTAYWDSFGLSIEPQTSQNTRVINNYISGFKTGGFSTTDSSGTARWGYGIEYGNQTGIVSGNVVVGNWSNHIVVSTQNGVVQNNQMYGKPFWGPYITGEPGLGGWGTFSASGNTTNANAAAAPGVPAWALARVANPLGTGNVSPDPVPSQMILPPTNVTATAAGASAKIDLAWTNIDGSTGAQVYRKTRDGTDAWTLVATVAQGVHAYSDTSFTADQADNGWAFSYQVVTLKGNDSSSPSDLASAQLQTGVTPEPLPLPDPTPAPALPGQVKNVTVAIPAAGEVDLAWTNPTGSTGSKVYRKTRDGTDKWVLVGTVGNGVQSYVDKDFSDEQSKNTWAFQYQVVAFNEAGAGTYSSMITAQLVKATTDDTTNGGGSTSNDDSKGTYLSDLTWSSATNGWGSVEKDRSNGEKGSNDGRTITLNKKTYSKGLGVHAGSAVVYQLDGKYKTFTSDIGVDDEIGAGFGSVIFQVFGDGKLLYQSSVMRSSSSTVGVQVDTTGVQQLKLVVTGANDGNAYDHADWANAMVYAGAAPSVSGPTYVSDMTFQEVTNGYGTIEKDASNGEMLAGDGKVMSINGKTYAKGLGTHAGSKVAVDLNGKFSTFTSDIGVDDEVGLAGSVDFQIFADGVKIYDSGTMTGADAAKSVSVNVAGKQQLWLVVADANDGNSFDHADWAGAKLA